MSKGIFIVLYFCSFIPLSPSLGVCAWFSICSG